MISLSSLHNDRYRKGVLRRIPLEINLIKYRCWAHVAKLPVIASGFYSIHTCAGNFATVYENNIDKYSNIRYKEKIAMCRLPNHLFIGIISTLLSPIFFNSIKSINTFLQGLQSASITS